MFPPKSTQKRKTQNIFERNDFLFSSSLKKRMQFATLQFFARFRPTEPRRKDFTRARRQKSYGILPGLNQDFRQTKVGL